MIIRIDEKKRRADGLLDSASQRRLTIVDLQGVGIHALTEADAVLLMMRAMEAGQGGWVITPNLDHLRRAQRDPEFRDMLAEADLVVPDGMPLIWASRLQGTPLPERVAGSSLVSSLASRAAQRQRSLFLLGGAPGAAERAGEVLQHRYPGLRLAGTACPPVGFEKEPAQIDALRRQLQRARPDMVYVALGSPKQERLIRELRRDFPATWWLGVGISLSFLAGQVQRAPQWMQQAGLEWLHRLSQEPGRLARRYLLDGVPFALCLLGRAGCRRLIRSGGNVRRGRLNETADHRRMADVDGGV